MNGIHESPSVKGNFCNNEKSSVPKKNILNKFSCEFSNSNRNFSPYNGNEPNEIFHSTRNPNSFEKKNFDEGKKNKVFVEREGDWICAKCKNLNFSFRTFCNRCKISKEESLCIYDHQMKMMNEYVICHDSLQNQNFYNYLNLMNPNKSDFGGINDISNRNYYY